MNRYVGASRDVDGCRKSLNETNCSVAMLATMRNVYQSPRICSCYESAIAIQNVAPSVFFHIGSCITSSILARHIGH